MTTPFRPLKVGRQGDCTMPKKEPAQGLIKSVTPVDRPQLWSKLEWQLQEEKGI